MPIDQDAARTRPVNDDGPIADATSREEDYGETQPEPPEHPHALPWCVYQAFDPERHAPADRRRVALALRDADASVHSPFQRRAYLALAGLALDEAAALRAQGEAVEGDAFLLRILGLPADYFDRLAEEETARAAEVAANPPDPCSCGWGSPGHAPMFHPVEGGMEELDRIIAAEGDSAPPPEARYADRAVDPNRRPIERAIARLLVERGEHYTDDDFDDVMDVMADPSVEVPALDEGGVLEFARTWLDAAHGRREADADELGLGDLGGLGGEVDFDDDADDSGDDGGPIGLCAVVARGGRPGSSEVAVRVLERVFATQRTVAHSLEDLIRGRRRVLGRADAWPSLLAEARALRPGLPEAIWKRVAGVQSNEVGPPAVAHLLKIADRMARERPEPPLPERVARSIARNRRVQPVPRRVPGRCEKIHIRGASGPGGTLELCPNPATVDFSYSGEGLDGHTMRYCDECAEFARKLGEHNDRVLAEGRNYRAARRAPAPEVGE